MRQIMIKLLFCSVLISLFASCKRDHLYYSTGGSAAILFNVDWEKPLLEPNGVSIYSYDAQSGKAITQAGISSNPAQIEVAHPVGTYDFLLINDTEYELDNILFADVENLETFKVLAKAGDAPVFGNLSDTRGVQYATETDIVAVEKVHNLKITTQDIEYFDSKPATGDHEIFKTVKAEPERITELIEIEIMVKNIASAAGAPRSHLTNMSAGYWLGLEQKHEQLLTHEFVLNNKQMLASDSKTAMISKKLVSFGPHRTRGELTNQHELIMHFVLVNGDSHVVRLDVTNQIESAYDGVQNVHKIKAVIELPLAIGGGGGGPFDPDVEDWEDVEVELPI